MRKITKRIKNHVKEAKDIYKKKLEDEFASKNPKRTWDCLKQITGSGKDRVKVKVSNELSYANELNRQQSYGS